ncbi:MAG: FAD-binding protein, partial [Desulfamplus sp.]|nr:FAD-binding protein [Desulfamplus sp.]
MENNNTLPVIKTDLTVIGSGMAGLSAAIFALNRGFSTVITGKRSSMNFATGLMDLMGVHPSGNEWDNPWEAIDMARKDIPGHPYRAVKNEDILQSIQEIVDFLKIQGLTYKMKEKKNVNVITSLGTVKKSYVIPESMWNGVSALENRAPSLIIDFSGMKIYSAKQIVSTLSEIWPQLQSARIDFPGMEKLEEVYPEHIARALDVEENRARLAELIKPLLNNSSPCKSDSSQKSGYNQIQYLGFPALLGMYKSGETIRQLEELLGIPVFEIPTPPVSVPGIRLYEALTQGLGKNSNLISVPEMVKSVEPLENGTFRIKTGSASENMASETTGGIPAPYIVDNSKKNQIEITDRFHQTIPGGN